MKRTDIEKLLPGIFQQTLHRENPLFALLEVMERLHEPSEAVLAQIDTAFDPYCSRDDFVSFLAGWVDLEWLIEKSHDAKLPSSSQRDPVSTGLGRLRELIARAAYLSQWRGTAKGLLLFLQITTGMDDFEINEEIMGDDGRLRPFHILILAPEAARVHRTLIERIIKKEKPAYVTFNLEFKQK
jgi:phage tail-like protein